MSLLDRYITRSAQGNVLWLGPESLKQLQIELHALETETIARVQAAEAKLNLHADMITAANQALKEAVCPNVITAKEGTQLDLA